MGKGVSKHQTSYIVPKTFQNDYSGVLGAKALVGYIKNGPNRLFRIFWYLAFLPKTSRCSGTYNTHFTTIQWVAEVLADRRPLVGLIFKSQTGPSGRRYALRGYSKRAQNREILQKSGLAPKTSR